jgi:alpha(1,3/1,4) fucosyltransferase
MNRNTVTINIARFWQGATVEELVDLVLGDLKTEFNFEVSDTPQLLLYGPYAGPMPQGDFLKVFIGCENVRPIMSECDWAFGVAHDDVIGHPRYMRIVRWGPPLPRARTTTNWSRVLAEKTRFCVFLFSNPMPFREAFFKALSRYKPIDAPGKSMNNMPSIDEGSSEGIWDTKIRFLRQYKFVIAFENSTTPGYNTEKLTHAIEADSMPIYWGDPQIERSFNEGRFINAHRFLGRQPRLLPRSPLHQHSTRNHHPAAPWQRAARKFDRLVSECEQSIWAWQGFDRLVEEVVRLDCDDDLYLQRLEQPFLIDDEELDLTPWNVRWRQILSEAAARPRGSS